MSSYVANLCYVEREKKVCQLLVRKRKGETWASRFGRVAAMAITYNARHYAVRRDGEWEIWPVPGPEPILRGLTKDAATMWLLHRGVR